MKKFLLTAIATLVTSAAFAQAAPGTAPAAAGAASPGSVGTGTATKEDITGKKSTTEQRTSDKAQMKVDAKTGMSQAPMANANTPAMMAMDTNGDGMISRREYDAHHAAMWKSMKHTKGMVSQADMDIVLKGGPAGK